MEQIYKKISLDIFKLLFKNLKYKGTDRKLVKVPQIILYLYMYIYKNLNGVFKKTSKEFVYRTLQFMKYHSYCSMYS